MLVPMSPTSSMFLLAETREHPMHVGSLQLFEPPAGATALDVRALFEAALIENAAAPLFTKRPRRSVTTLGQWGWEPDRNFDLEHHVRRSALPQPGRILDLLALVSRLHSTLLDRHRPLWEMHLIEGLDDGRYAVYFKVHHAMVDGVSALRMLGRMLSDDPAERDMPAPWAPRSPTRTPSRPERPDLGTEIGRYAGRAAAEAVQVLPTLARALNRARKSEAGSVSFVAPRSILNVKITGARRFAAQSWPMDRIRGVADAAGTTVNDVVLAMCSGALREYLLDLDALPDRSLVAAVPVSLHGEHSVEHDGGGNAIGAVMCTLGTDLDDAGDRLEAVHRSMVEGKESMQSLSPTQALVASAVGVAPLVPWVFGLVDHARPPFNLIISNVPGPREPLYWNGAKLDGLYPLSIPLDGQALNITCTSYSDELAFGLTGCRRTVPHLQRLLAHLDDELIALEKSTGGR